MATISSVGVGTNGLDVKNIIAKLVELEKEPLNKLTVQAATVKTKISAFGQIKSLVSTLQDAASKLTSGPSTDSRNKAWGSTAFIVCIRLG